MYFNLENRPKTWFSFAKVTVLCLSVSVVDCTLCRCNAAEGDNVCLCLAYLLAIDIDKLYPVNNIPVFLACTVCRKLRILYRILCVKSSAMLCAKFFCQEVGRNLCSSLIPRLCIIHTSLKECFQTFLIAYQPLLVRTIHTCGRVIVPALALIVYRFQDLPCLSYLFVQSNSVKLPGGLQTAC